MHKEAIKYILMQHTERSIPHCLERDLAVPLATALRGRSVFYEVFPLSFREFLRFRDVEYTKWGGLPEPALADPTMRPLILEEYFSLIFYKDILERFDIRNGQVLRLLMKTCCSQPACLLSVRKLYRTIKSMGFSVSKK